MKKKIIFICWLAICVIIGVVTGIMGYHINQWQWRACCGCTWISYLLGALNGMESR